MSGTQATPGGTRRYLYGVTVAGAAWPADVRGIAGRVVGCIEAGGLRALVSPVDDSVLDVGDPHSPEDTAEQAAEAMRAHDAVLKAVLGLAPVVPLRFGTVLTHDADIQALLFARQRRFEELLATLEGTSEWGLKATWDQEDRRRYVAANQPEEARAEAAAGEGTSYLLARRRDRDIDARVRQVQERVVTGIHDRLSAAARASTLLASRARDHPAGLVLNASYLVAEDETAAFDDRVADLQRDREGTGIELVRTGPWPPYSFVGTDVLGRQS